jgi:hypothetical protein
LLEARTCADNDDKLKIFMWYWDCLLPCAAFKENFGKKQRYKTILSQSVQLEGARVQLVHPSTEAFTLLCYENNKAKWEKGNAFLVEAGVCFFVC